MIDLGYMMQIWQFFFSAAFFTCAIYSWLQDGKHSGFLIGMSVLLYLQGTH